MNLQAQSNTKAAYQGAITRRFAQKPARNPHHASVKRDRFGNIAQDTKRFDLRQVREELS